MLLREFNYANTAFERHHGQGISQMPHCDMISREAAVWQVCGGKADNTNHIWH